MRVLEVSLKNGVRWSLRQENKFFVEEGLSVCVSVSLCLCVSVYVSVCLCVCVSVCLCVCVFASQSSTRNGVALDFCDVVCWFDRGEEQGKD